MKNWIIVAFMIYTVSGMTEEKSVMTKPRPVTLASELKPHVGILIGAAQPEGSGITASEFAVDVGYQPYIPFGIAAEFNHAYINDGTESVDRNTLWLKATYNLGGTTPVIRESYVGFGVGAVFKPSSTSAAIAPIAGFDIPVSVTPNEMFTLGGSLRYAIVGDNEVDTLSVSGVLKYWY